MTCLRIVLLAAATVACASAQSFSFYSTLRAGLPAGLDWEMGVGSNTNANDSQRDFFYQGTPGNVHWRANDLAQSFLIGWTASTNTAYVTVFNAAGRAITTNFTNAGPALAPTATWTLPANTFLASASGGLLPSSITLQNLSFSPGVQVLSGALPTNIAAAQTGSTVMNQLSAPIVINPASSGGNWYISGQVRFSGLLNSGGVATGSQLQFLLGATGSNASPVPETSTSALVGIGLVGAALWQRKTRRGAKSA